MTDQTITPTQRDREAAARGMPCNTIAECQRVADVMSGRFDSHQLVQDFARHAATERELADKGMREALEKAQAFLNCPDGGTDSQYSEAVEAVDAALAAKRPSEGKYRDKLIETIRHQLASTDYPVSDFEREFADAVIALQSVPVVDEECDALIIDLRARIDSVVEFSGHGCWVTCTGCAESSEGVLDSRYYPHSKVLGCQLGGGCSECGGIGAVWDDTDYEDMARSMLAEDAAK